MGGEVMATKLNICKIEGCSYFPVMNERCHTHLWDEDSPFRIAIEATTGKRLHISTYGGKPRGGFHTVRHWQLSFDGLFLCDTDAPHHVSKWLELVDLVERGVSNPMFNIIESNKNVFVEEITNPDLMIKLFKEALDQMDCDK